ncbi:VTC domain-containing protein [Novipirellula maiorica]|uniref:VTC domain-containing protein n=1 Tax=Novipirellula maiorica TaxID=1265734 RepID=UPI00034C2FE6|nr:VTC domain-containing protein [Rhodopirellula maiorica]
MKFPPRYECTFVLDDVAAAALIDSASRRMDPPISSDVSDLYYDSETWRRPTKTKAIDKEVFRVRRIDHAWDVFLEQQRRDKQTTKLRRTIAPSSELRQLELDGVNKTWEGKWFHKNIVKHGLQRSLQIQFDRIAFNANSIEGPLRLTLDRNVHCRAFSDSVDPVRTPSTPIAMHLVRMKFFVSLPAIFKSLIYEYTLLPQPTSMYRECVLRYPVDQCAAMFQSLSTSDAMLAEPVATDEVATCQFG